MVPCNLNWPLVSIGVHIPMQEICVMAVGSLGLESSTMLVDGYQLSRDTSCNSFLCQLHMIGRSLFRSYVSFTITRLATVDTFITVDTVQIVVTKLQLLVRSGALPTDSKLELVC